MTTDTQPNPHGYTYIPPSLILGDKVDVCTPNGTKLYGVIVRAFPIEDSMWIFEDSNHKHHYIPVVDRIVYPSVIRQPNQTTP